MRLRYQILTGLLAAYSTIWLAAWLRLKLAGDPGWIRGLKRGLAAVGAFNSRVILTLLYLLLLPFFAVFFILRDALDVRGGERASYWRPLPKVPATPERYRHPY